MLGILLELLEVLVITKLLSYIVSLFKVII